MAMIYNSDAASNCHDPMQLSCTFCFLVPSFIERKQENRPSVSH